jgi:hypothetical protein
VLFEIQFNPDVLLAMAAMLTAIGGIFATMASMRIKKMEQKKIDDDDCFAKLMAARKEAEVASDELHAIRMRKAQDIQ